MNFSCADEIIINVYAIYKYSFLIALCSCTVSKGIVELHGGRLTLYSAGEGHGTSFFVDLPAHRYFVEGKEDGNEDIVDLTQLRACSKNYLCTFDPLDSHVHGIHNKVLINHSNSIPEKTVSITSPTACKGTGDMIQANNGKEKRWLRKDESSNNNHNTNNFVDSSSRHSCGSALDLPSSSSVVPITVENNIPSSSHEQVLVTNSSSPKLGRVLAVDDVPLNLKMMRRALKDKVDVFVEAGDGLEAVKEVKNSMQSGAPYDVILMDFVMPNMDGPHAARQIRSMGYEGKIIGVTGNAQQADIDHFLSHGADRVLLKPIDMTVLEEAIKGV